MRQQLANGDPYNWTYKYDLAWADHLLGGFYLGPGGNDLEKATMYHQAAYKIRGQLTDVDPTNTRWRKDFALSLEALGDIADGRDDREGVRSNYEASRAILQTLLDNDPTNGALTRLLSSMKVKIAKLEAISVPADAVSQRQ